VHEPPSHDLVRQLTELQLCRPDDLKRARGRVRRLSYDLPAFDSVWIDSLVQLRLLTPYQGRMLERGQADQLRIGPFVVIDELGHGRGRATYIAQRLTRRDRRVLKRYAVGPDRIDAVRDEMAQMLERANGFAHPHVVLPNEVLPLDHNEVVTVSRFVPGLPLNELLVRRGRFPAAIVFEIGRQLLDGLAALHKKSLVHGDIRMSNVRLTDNGLVVLVDGATRPIIHPEITIHDNLSLEAYDGMAPELIGTGESPSASSELYSVGCLLWQLLAGRPPYPTADSLAKLAAHQTQTIDDVRTWAPDTPAMLAQTIRQLTSPMPEQRPRSANEVLQRWGKPGAFSRSRLKQFRRLFEGDVPHFAGPVVRDRISGGVWMSVLLFTVTGVVGLMYDAGMRNELLNIGQEFVQKAKELARRHPESTDKRPEDQQNHSTASSLKPVGQQGDLLPLPVPENGLILLDKFGPYDVTQTLISHKGDLIIRAAAGIRPEIHVENASLRLDAASVSLEGLLVRRRNDGRPGGRLLSIRSQRLRVLNCEFRSNSGDEDETENKPQSASQNIVAIAWRPQKGDVSQGDALEITNSVFHGDGAAVLFLQTPRSQAVFSNTLKTGSGAFVKLAPTCVASNFQIEFNRVTLRESGPLLVLAGEAASKTGVSPVAVTAQDSVFQLADIHRGLIVIEANKPRKDRDKSIAMNFSNSVAAPGTELVTAFNPERNSLEQIPEEEFGEQFSGLSYGEIKFGGSNLANPMHSNTTLVVAPTGTEDALPGVDSQLLGPSRRPRSD
jgi:eukaryotic-like serine/threonine-protein kinase